jgi:hypothetical protein
MTQTENSGDYLDVICDQVKRSNGKLGTVVQVLKGCNIPIVKVYEGDQVSDPCVEVDKNCHIQIELDGVYSLSQLLPDGRIRCLPSRKNLAAVIADYQQVAA